MKFKKMSDARKLKFVLGMAQKSGKLASGDFWVKSSFKENKVKFLFLAKDASENSKKELYYLSQGAGVTIDESLTASEIGSSIGKDIRICAALLDDNFLKMLV